MQRTIEQLLEIIARSNSTKDEDAFFFNSINKQLHKNLAMTHKQYSLVKTKLYAYANIFKSLGIDDYEVALNTTQLPLRIADKEKTIKVVSLDLPFRTHAKQYIEIKFPFNKKEINLVDTLKKSAQKSSKSFYYKKENLHYFSYSEDFLYEIITTFSDRNFAVEDELQETYEKIKFIKNNPHLYVPGIYGDKVQNLHKEAEKAVYSELGDLTAENAIKFLDRKRRFGLEVIEFADEHAASIERQSPSALKIASRTGADYLSKPDEEKLEDLLSAVTELDRFPLLVILSDQISPSIVLEQLTSVHTFFSKVVDNEMQSVLFRLDNTTDVTAKQFNSYIKDNKINNWVDSSTKIVYINYDKLPKVLLKSNWMPLASLSFSNLNRSVVSVYIESVCDLNIIREKDFSIIKQYKKNK